MLLSVVLITFNEEANIARTLQSVAPLVQQGRGEIIVVDSGSTDRTLEIAQSLGARVFSEEWKGFAAQKNSALAKASGEWVLSLDADEELSNELAEDIEQVLADSAPGAPQPRSAVAYWIPRRNYFLGRWTRHGGFWPDPKVRLFRKCAGQFEDRAVHEDVKVEESGIRPLRGCLIHHSYPTLSDYIDHINRYSSLGAEMVLGRQIPHTVAENATRVGHPRVGFSVINIVLRPLATFMYNYFFRLGFLDGREGLVLHLYHAVYVSWKYAKAWELGRKRTP